MNSKKGKGFNWKDEWNNMPEYNNKEYPNPVIVVTFKFLSLEDYNKFYAVIKKELFKGEKPFDGRQRKNIKTTWYPHKEQSKNYYYTDESDDS